MLYFPYGSRDILKLFLVCVTLQKNCLKYEYETPAEFILKQS